MSKKEDFLYDCEVQYADFCGMQLLYVDEMFRKKGVDRFIKENYRLLKKCPSYMEEIDLYIQSIDNPDFDPYY